ncbi:MAG TPA: hypothetical protein VLX28_01660 [Thermoanaerobaculia bacterium]|nr:hypothetical protein [Thermoanaerobaculia bacterium]
MPLIPTPRFQVVPKERLVWTDALPPEVYRERVAALVETVETRRLS